MIEMSMEVSKLSVVSSYARQFVYEHHATTMQCVQGHLSVSPTFTFVQQILHFI